MTTRMILTLKPQIQSIKPGKSNMSVKKTLNLNQVSTIINKLLIELPGQIYTILNQNLDTGTAITFEKKGE